MFRVLLFAFAIGITLYAMLDWGFTSRLNTPGRVSRWIWLAVIVLIPILGPLAWTVLRIVEKAEGSGASDATKPSTTAAAPDDDPEFLDNISRRIERRQKRTRAPGPSAPNPQSANGEETGASEGDDVTPDE